MSRWSTATGPGIDDEHDLPDVEPCHRSRDRVDADQSYPGVRMGADGAAHIRSGAQLREFLRVAPPSPPTDLEVEWTESRGPYELSRVRYAVPDGDVVPAFLLRPGAGPCRVGVVAFHQHNSRWHLGKSEVVGLAGDPLQAFGPALAAAGVAVLAPDALGFEDRRRHASGVDAHDLDKDHYIRELTHRLVVGDTLARRTLDDACHAVTMLAAQRDVETVGVIGHSFGGHQTLFLSAIDPRVRFACASGAAGSFRARMARGIGIGFDQVVPGIATRMDFHTFVECIAPRPLLLVAGENDRHAMDAADIAAAGRAAYERQRAAHDLDCRVLPGEHALTDERHEVIVDWTLAMATRFGHPPEATGDA